MRKELHVQYHKSQVEHVLPFRFLMIIKTITTITTSIDIRPPHTAPIIPPDDKVSGSMGAKKKRSKVITKSTLQWLPNVIYPMASI